MSRLTVSADGTLASEFSTRTLLRNEKGSAYLTKRLVPDDNPLDQALVEHFSGARNIDRSWADPKTLTMFGCALLTCFHMFPELQLLLTYTLLQQ
jgi:hypothetical protein